ncbi:MAG: TolC family protein [Acidobacteria bacterium]|nr:TolC family protein [Acidobacteriota bacterium]
MTILTIARLVRSQLCSWKVSMMSSRLPDRDAVLLPEAATVLAGTDDSMALIRQRRPRTIHRAAALLAIATLLQAGTLRAEPPVQLTLHDCVSETLAANHALLARSAERDAARARAEGSRAARLPRSVPLYAGGRLVAEQNATRLLAEAASGDLAIARQRLAVGVVALYQDGLALRAVIRSLDQSRATLTAQIERIDALLRQQKAAEVDRLRVAVRLARVEQNAVEARSRLETTKTTLAVLMGHEPSAAWKLADDLITPDVPQLSTTGYVSMRADEAAAQARVASASEQVRAARAGWLPGVDAIAAYGSRADIDGSEAYGSGLAGLALTWNIHDFGRTEARVAESHAILRAREEAAVETSLQRRLELANADAGVRSAVARIEASRMAVEQARESLRIEQKKYEFGHGTATDVLDAQAATDEAESLRARALADYAIWLAAHDLATGHVFTSAAATAVLRADPITDSRKESSLAP